MRVEARQFCVGGCLDLDYYAWSEPLSLRMLFRTEGTSAGHDDAHAPSEVRAAKRTQHAHEVLIGSSRTDIEKIRTVRSYDGRRIREGCNRW